MVFFERRKIMENFDFSTIVGYVQKGIKWVEDSGIIEKIPEYVQKAVDLIAQYAPKVIDFIAGLIK